MSTPTRQIVRPAGAGHETLNVLLLCLLILAVAGSVVAWRHESQDTTSISNHQLDARRDLSASEQGIYADLRVTLDEVRLLQQEQATRGAVSQNPISAQALQEQDGEESL